MKPILQMHPDAQRALETFSTAFDKALTLGEVEDWAGVIGYVETSDNYETTYPLPVTAAGYVRRTGDDRMRSLFARSLSIIPEEWVDGVIEEERKLKRMGAEMIGWANAPAEMALEAKRHKMVLVADMLARNPYLKFYKERLRGGEVGPDRALFASDHPANVLLPAKYPTFNNDWDAGTEWTSGLVDKTLVAAVRKHFRGIRGANGRPLGLELGGFLITTKWEEEFRDLLERSGVLEALKNVLATENVAAGVLENRYKGTGIIVAPELTGDMITDGVTGDEDVVYAWATKRGGSIPYPWVTQVGATQEEIVYDRSSDVWRNEGKVGLKKVLTAGCEAALPHAFLRIDLSP